MSGALVDLELRFLAKPYEDLRLRDAAHERQVLASLEKDGQQHPILVVAGPEDRFTLVDGHVRVRALMRLGQELVRAQVLAGPVVDALVHVQIGLSQRRPAPLEEAWLVRELIDNHRLPFRDVAARFSRTTGWVQGRLDLLRDLPESIQDLVVRGHLGGHVAQRVLLPLARMNRAHAEAAASAFVSTEATTREAQDLLAHYRKSTTQARQVLVSNAVTFVKALRVPADAVASHGRPLTGDDRSLAERLIRLARAADACARELAGRTPDSCSDSLRTALAQGAKAVHSAMTRLARALASVREEPQGGSHDQPGDAPHDPHPGAEEPRDPGDRPGPQHPAQHGEADPLRSIRRDAVPGSAIAVGGARREDRTADRKLSREPRARGRRAGEDRRDARVLLDAHAVLPRAQPDPALPEAGAGG